MDMLGALETEYKREDLDPDPTVRQESGEEWLHLAILIEENSTCKSSDYMRFNLTKNRIDIQDRVHRLTKEPWESSRLEVEQLRQNLTAQFLLLQSL